MKIIVDKSTAIKAICELHQIAYNEDFVHIGAEQFNTKIVISKYDQIIFDFEHPIPTEKCGTCAYSYKLSDQ